MAAERDLVTLLIGMHPVLNPGRYVYCTLPTKVPPGLRPVVTVTEDEGITVVVPQDDADSLGLRYDFVAAWITLRIHSALEAVGLTAAVSSELAAHGISCNVAAGFHHDHLFVPAADGERAVRVLEELSVRQG
ncbi:ACT domain-containing protein [Kitasatospora sp. NPDC051914]|uniref:ACT domain-containing protein n=1 Tax=unclassified Kitasatospora TaxID=2633591 RepID=UPI003435C8E0